MGKVILSLKAMRWLVQVLIEASKGQRMTVGDGKQRINLLNSFALLNTMSMVGMPVLLQYKGATDQLL